MTLILADARAEIAKRKLAARRLSHFIKLWFERRRQPLLWNWHLDYLCEVMEGVAHRHLMRVLINMPFRSLKTEVCEQAWQPWMILQDDSPNSSVLSAAATYDLAVSGGSAKSREILLSEWYQDLATNVTGRPVAMSSKSTESDWETVGGTRRQAAGAGGTVTGRGGAHLIWGDIIKPEEANSDLVRTKACTWLGETFRSRLNDPKTGTITGIMQRLHELDPAGYLIEQMKTPGADQYFTVKIEMECEKPKVYTYGDFYYERKAGELLHPARVDAKEIQALKVNLGNNYEGQCNQNPVKMQGNFFKMSWFNWYKGDPPAFTHTYQTWDFALTEEDQKGGDYTVCATWGRTKGGQHYLVDLFRAKINSVNIIEEILAQANKHRPLRIYGEKAVIEKAILPFLQERMRETSQFFAVDVIPLAGRDKTTRAIALQSMARLGTIYLPEHHRSSPDMKLELAAFPLGAHDDIVDAMSNYGLVINEVRPSELKAAIAKPGPSANTAAAGVIAADVRKVLGATLVPGPIRRDTPAAAAVSQIKDRKLVVCTREEYQSFVRREILAFEKESEKAFRGRDQACARGELNRLDRLHRWGKDLQAKVKA